MRDLRFRAAVFRQDETLSVVASFRINQSEFGIEPFSALNGGLLVRDPVDIRIRVVARRGPPLRPIDSGRRIFWPCEETRFDA